MVFYAGGSEGGFFRGTCRLASGPIRFPPEAKRYIIEDPQDKFNYFVNLKEVDLFPSPKPIAALLDDMKFITNKENWWRNLQGGIISIPGEDFYNIVNSK